MSQPFEDFIWKNSRMTHQNRKAYYKLSLGFCSPTFSCGSFAEVQGGGGEKGREEGKKSILLTKSISTLLQGKTVSDALK